MSENIAGYIDRNYIKGQTYKIAGCPKPVIANSSTNIDDISDSLLTKAMYATKGQTAGGTFPSDTGLTFLITTIEYGNSVYLQTAFSTTTGYEYTRIYSGGSWTSWRTIEDKIDAANTNAADALNRVANSQSTLEDYWNRTLNTDNSDSVLSIARLASTNASTAISTAQSANEVSNSISNRFAALGTKIDIITASFEGTIPGHKNSSEITINVTGFSSIIAVIPYTYHWGGNAITYNTQLATAAIPWIKDIIQPTRQEGGSWTGSFIYRLYRPDTGDGRYSDHITKFLIFGIAGS